MCYRIVYAGTMHSSGTDSMAIASPTRHAYACTSNAAACMLTLLVSTTAAHARAGLRTATAQEWTSSAGSGAVSRLDQREALLAAHSFVDAHDSTSFRNLQSLCDSNGCAFASPNLDSEVTS